MRTKRRTAAFVLLAVALVGFLAAAGDTPAKRAPQTAAAPSEKPLVRKDLLPAGGPDAPAPLRDIFRPKAFGVPQAFVFRPMARKPEAAAAPAAPTFTLSLTYVGPIASSGKILAMVTVGDKSLPVSVGDEVSPGYKVLRISSDSIDIEGPGGQVKTFTR